MKQTAVEWLIEQLRQLAHNPNTHLGMGDIRVTQGYLDELEEQANKMFEQQMIDAVNIDKRQYDDAQQYYTSTYESKGITLQNESESKVITELSDDEIKKTPFYKMINDTFKAGAKWQQEQLKNR